MRHWGIVLFGWWFLSFGSYGGTSGTAVFAPIGPFTSREDCEKVKEWATRQGHGGNVSQPTVSWCWHDGKN